MELVCIHSLFEQLIPFHSQLQSQETPMFCFAGAGGHFQFCQGLDRHLQVSRSIYGLRELSPEEYDSIESMAAIYVQTLQQTQPEGDYLIAGYPFGGLVALEVAQQLHAQGKTVAQLILIDPSHPPIRLKTLRRSLNQSWNRLHRVLYRAEVHWLRISAMSQSEKLSYIQDKLNLAFRLLSRRSAPIEVQPTPEQAEQKLSKVWKQYKFYLRLRDRHIPQRYDQPICLVLSEERSRDVGQWANWRSISSSVRSSVICSTNHHSICKEPFIQEVVRLLESDLPHSPILVSTR